MIKKDRLNNSKCGYKLLDIVNNRSSLKKRLEERGREGLGSDGVEEGAWRVREREGPAVSEERRVSANKLGSGRFEGWRGRDLENSPALVCSNAPDAEGVLISMEGRDIRR